MDKAAVVVNDETILLTKVYLLSKIKLNVLIFYFDVLTITYKDFIRYM